MLATLKLIQLFTSVALGHRQMQNAVDLSQHEDSVLQHDPHREIALQDIRSCDSERPSVYILQTSAAVSALSQGRCLLCEVRYADCVESGADARLQMVPLGVG